MCTAMILRAKDGTNYLGRTMDFSYPLQPHCYVVSRGYQWQNIVNNRVMQNTYSFIGIGQELDGQLGVFDGVNEHGLAAAALYFAGYAQYDTIVRSITPIPVASYDLLHYILANCTSVEDVYAQLQHIHIIGESDPLTQTVAPLHWIATDRSGKCIVIEQTKKGLEFFHNPIGVLANSPDFSWHMTNLRNYMQISPHQLEEVMWEHVRLTPYGQGGGTMSLPGGYTSPERFVRIAYLKSHSLKPDNHVNALSTFFQIIKSVSIPKGAVVTARGTDDYTQYTTFINLNNCEYFFNTYENLQIKKAGFSFSEAIPGTLIDLGKLIQPMIYEAFTIN